MSAHQDFCKMLAVLQVSQFCHVDEAIAVLVCQVEDALSLSGSPFPRGNVLLVQLEQGFASCRFFVMGALDVFKPFWKTQLAIFIGIMSAHHDFCKMLAISQSGQL